MKRRDVFRLLAFTAAPAATAIGIARAPVVGNSVPIRDGVAVWSGWRELPSQIVTIGWWYLVRPNGRMVYATTLGVIGEVSELGTLDLSRQKGWPVVRSASDEAAEPIRRRALQRLIIALDTGEFNDAPD
jgi:hypothetical protein